MLSQIVLAACLCLSANAFVDYGDAALYDEFDFSTYKSFPLAECLASSCKVYVSAPESSLPTLEKIYLGDTTLAALARNVDSNTGLKAPYNLKAYSGKNFITNLNWKFASAPVAVYVVYQRATFFSSALVYEPTSAALTVQWKNASTLTLLSATNFTVQGAVREGSLAFGRVVAGGYDAAQRNWARIPALYEFTEDKHFEFSTVSPLVTLYSFFPADVEVTIESGFKEPASSRIFLASPGYTGVLSGQVYLSSTYNKTVQYRLSYEKPTSIHITALLNTLGDNVELFFDGNKKLNISGTRGLSTYYQILDVVESQLEVRFTKSTPFSSFLLRIDADIEVPTTSTEAPVTTEAVTERPASSEAPATSRPATDAPVVPSEAPVTTRSLTDAPVVPSEAPVTTRPLTDSPVVLSEAPVTARPVTDGPIDATVPVETQTDAPVAPVVTELPVVPRETEQPVPVNQEEPSETETNVPIVAEDLRRKFPVHPIA